MTMSPIAQPELAPPPSPLSVPDADGVCYPDASEVCPIDTMLQYIPQSYMQWVGPVQLVRRRPDDPRRQRYIHLL